MKKRIIAVLTAVCLMAGTGAFAQQAKKSSMPKERPTAEQMAQRQTDRMTQELKLNESQSKQVYDVCLAQIKDMESHREKMRAAREADAQKMKGILTPAQYEQWSQMQGPKFCGHHGKKCMKDKDRKECKGGKCDKSADRKN